LKINSFFYKKRTNNQLLHCKKLLNISIKEEQNMFHSIFCENIY
jgi:hypothetical protein